MIVVVFIESLSDIFAKEWSLKNHHWLFAAALTGYIVTNLFWLWALKEGVGLARGAVVFSVGSAILGVVVGLFYYKEVLSSLQVFGIILGMISFILIFWE